MVLNERNLAMEGKKLSIFDALVFSFRITIDHIRLFVIISLIGILLVIGVLSIAALFNVDFINSFYEISPYLQQFQTCVGPACITIVRPLIPLIKSHSITLMIAGFVLGIVLCGLDLGTKKVGLDLYETDKSSVGVAFSYFYLAPKVMLAWILYLIMILGGFVLFIVPGIFLFLRLGFFPYFILEKNASVVDSFRDSYSLTQGYIWDLFALWIISRLILQIGSIAWFGAFISWPIYLLLYVFIYRKLTE